MLTSNVLRLAAPQHGVVSNRQLADLGVSRSALSRARSAGKLVDVAPGIVRPASSPETLAMRCRAVQLRAAEVGFLSGWTAGRIHGLRAMPTRLVHYTTPQRFDRSMPRWVDIHRSRWFDTDDREVRPDGSIIARPMRMLFGLAASFNQHRFERAAEDAWHLGLITPDAAFDYLQLHRCRGKDGVATIETWLERAGGRCRPTQSNLERSLLEALERAGLPEPVRQHPLTLEGGETIHFDIAWPALRLAVEPGASWWHGGDQGQRRDQHRDRACAELDWMVVRFDETMREDLWRSVRQIVRIHARRTISFRNVRGSSR